jgi:hypothetical protein
VLQPRRLATELEQTVSLAQQVRSQPLPFAVRELGEIYRRVGRSQSELSPSLVSAQVQSWRDMLRTVVANVGTRPILQLRALQCSLLVAAMRDWQATGRISDDLVELGGDLMSLVKANRESLTDAECWSLALKRWTNLAGLTNNPAFQPSREIELTQLHYFYSHPTDDGDAFDTRVRILHRYAQLDPAYPVNYGLGVLMASGGRLSAAATSFAKHLELHPNGPFALRARNHLLWTVQRLNAVGDNGTQ